MDVAVVSQPNQSLYEIVSGAAPASIDDVLRKMRQVDELLADDDGLKWFNRLYMMVTEEVDVHPPSDGWRDADWLLRLDVVFAEFYFRAIAGFLDGSSNTASSWNALMAVRYEPGIDRIQFALAGMNAHINHDLALALLETDREMKLVPGAGSPQHVDYLAVNELLNRVMPSALEMLAVGILGLAAEETGKVGRVLAFCNICQARDLAWDFADHLRGLDGVARGVALAAQDHLTGAAGRTILGCV